VLGSSTYSLCWDTRSASATCGGSPTCATSTCGFHSHSSLLCLIVFIWLFYIKNADLKGSITVTFLIIYQWKAHLTHQVSVMFLFLKEHSIPRQVGLCYMILKAAKKTQDHL